jgi:hypothetical protein
MADKTSKDKAKELLMAFIDSNTSAKKFITGRLADDSMEQLVDFLGIIKSTSVANAILSFKGAARSELPQNYANRISKLTTSQEIERLVQGFNKIRNSDAFKEYLGSATQAKNTGTSIDSDTKNDLISRVLVESRKQTKSQPWTKISFNEAKEPENLFKLSEKIKHAAGDIINDYFKAKYGDFDFHAVGFQIASQFVDSKLLQHGKTHKFLTDNKGVIELNAAEKRNIKNLFMDYLNDGRKTSAAVGAFQEFNKLTKEFLEHQGYGKSR